MLEEVRDAFMGAMHTLLYVCSGIALVAALLALAFMPKQAAVPAKDTEQESAEGTRITGSVA
ncbi:hypothetical protein JHN52_37290 [Streptomyces sp. MBT97]|nr:hypothetical protein [Streptomyces sp. MBT97]MBK3638418.1 hypothetical protein [Streptomyces sp. MBT97]